MTISLSLSVRTRVISGFDISDVGSKDCTFNIRVRENCSDRSKGRNEIPCPLLCLISRLFVQPVKSWLLPLL